MLPRYLPYDDTGSAAVAPGSRSGNGTHVVLLRVRIPRGTAFHLKKFANSASDAAAFGSPGLQWTVVPDGMPHPYFNRIRDQLGLQYQLRELPSGLIVAYGSLEVWGENDHATSTFTALASVQGEFVPNE